VRHRPGLPARRRSDGGMKLARFGSAGAERPGVVLDDGTRVDVSSFVREYDEAFFGGDGVRALGAWLRDGGARAPRVGAGARVGAPSGPPRKIVCIGLTSRDPAAESQMDLPKEPVIFFK